ncbi:MAG: TetR/AcrR family transcriptional regulator [Flavobacteriaceae bacterium]|nr:TetR/AcrR family transcriptional regulator [Bacteroidia bacterium]MBT8288425.1 TetR/AcrR family transcriptional regulator [Bacteroidia bacterium]NNF73745.1 TetR/AcrR family transcriptional regulator [Flavobacteriaceae bacterium]NNK73304.1 TetR/AcrR family transcriptional regulator [Flavobacteriaceae bacterium]
MREKIIVKSVDLFLTLGFKSVTMDDIAQNLGCSKKTIYQHFENKTKLVEATTNYMFDIISKGIDHICALEKNPIDEIFDIKHFVMDHLKNEKSSPQYQLQKYYPKIFEALKRKQFEVMYGCVKENLRRGIAQGIFREDINTEFITRLYLNCVLAIKDNDLFPLTYFSMNELMENYLEYHLHGICTVDGLEYLSELNHTASRQINQQS